jgi:hypothetical protein
MTLKFVDEMGEGLKQYEGKEIESAEVVFGEAQARYFVETGHAKLVGATKTEKAVAKTGQTPE